MQLFQAPPLRHELVRQPVKQFGMCWAGAELAEIARGRYEPATEVMHPDSVDGHACDQWMLATGQPAREGEAAPTCRHQFIVRCEDVPLTWRAHDS